MDDGLAGVLRVFLNESVDLLNRNEQHADGSNLPLCRRSSFIEGLVVLLR